MEKHDLIEDLINIIEKKENSDYEIKYFKQCFQTPAIKEVFSDYLFRKSVDYMKFELSDFILEQGYRMSDKIHDEFVIHVQQENKKQIEYLLKNGYSINDTTLNTISNPHSKESNPDFFNIYLKPILLNQKIKKITDKINSGC